MICRRPSPIYITQVGARLFRRLHGADPADFSEDCELVEERAPVSRPVQFFLANFVHIA